MKRSLNIFFKSFVVLAAMQLTSNANACTRAMWVNDQAVVIARTMDWRGDMKSNLFVYPRGIERDGMADVNNMTWKSKYGSIITATYDATSSDGMNEKGLAAHVFWLIESDYGKRNESIPGMSILMWEQFYLDNFASVNEAVEYTATHPFQLEPFDLGGPTTLHLIISDSTGDNAIFEFIDGTLHTYHGKDLTVTSNSPSYDKQLQNLRLYKGFGGDKSLPGTTESMDRFVRAAYYSSHMPTPTSSKDAITKILSVIDSTVMPYGASSVERPEPSETIWKTALDLTHRIYYFESTYTRNLLWVAADEIDFSEGAPVLKLDVVNNPNLAGDVTKEFKPLDYSMQTQMISAKAVKRKMANRPR